MKKILEKSYCGAGGFAVTSASSSFAWLVYYLFQIANWIFILALLLLIIFILWNALKKQKLLDKKVKVIIVVIAVVLPIVGLSMLSWTLCI